MKSINEIIKQMPIGKKIAAKAAGEDGEIIKVKKGTKAKTKFVKP